MNPVIDERDIAEMEAHDHYIWRIQQAAKHKRRIFEDAHPDAIRERIKALQALLVEAGV